MRYISLLAAIAILASLASCGGNDEPTPDVLGCMDPAALNYNPDATKDDGSCSYEILGCTDPAASNYNPDATKDDGSCEYAVPTVPTSFTQKVLVEEVSGAWCGWCPDGLYFFEQLKKVYPDNVILISEHSGDAMELPNYNSGIDNDGYPTAAINRTPWNGQEELYLSRSDWGPSTQAILSKGSATIGVAIDTEFSGDDLKVTAHIGFGANQNNSYRLYIMLLEDKVAGTGSGYDQVNYTNNNPNSVFYQLGDPIIGYEHPDVLRDYAQDMNGIEVDATSVKAGGQFNHEVSFNTTAFNKNNLKVVAFVTEAHGKLTESPVINAQEVVAGENKDWD